MFLTSNVLQKRVSVCYQKNISEKYTMLRFSDLKSVKIYETVTQHLTLLWVVTDPFLKFLSTRFHRRTNV